jgi:hypothetical protein
VPLDWTRIRFTEHMTEAAALVGACRVVLEFTPAERASYDIQVYESLKGAPGDRFFAIGTNPDDPEGFRPSGAAATPEEALQTCLNQAGVHHRRRVKQAEGA